jgi:hypothetical protein
MVLNKYKIILKKADKNELIWLKYLHDKPNTFTVITFFRAHLYNHQHEVINVNKFNVQHMRMC